MGCSRSTRPEETVVGRTNFDHAPCYEQRLHPKTKQGRAWCRKHGPASMKIIP